MKQKAVIRVRAHCDKCRAKAMQVASKEGVESVAMEGKDRNEIVVVGEDIDIACLTKRLQSKVGDANILTVEEIDEEKIRKEKDEKKKKEDEEKKKREDKEKKEKEEAKETAEREKKELECYRKSKNPCYITPYVTDCHCKDDYHSSCIQPIQYPPYCYQGSQYPSYQPQPMMCIADDPQNNNACTIM
ncbi:hypothetical protein ZOSMA_100G00140 [Zostera marina]|uniref:HMA domain-containing protein n=1 Tax=Zostera marina TaxID=29655 RepID=A0A0K9Q5H8_ZOSMR|nr:hypothetical protein ZOSMA_100G00140 [Zostera marina]